MPIPAVVVVGGEKVGKEIVGVLPIPCVVVSGAGVVAKPWVVVVSGVPNPWVVVVGRVIVGVTSGKVNDIEGSVGSKSTVVSGASVKARQVSGSPGII